MEAALNENAPQKNKHNANRHQSHFNHVDRGSVGDLLDLHKSESNPKTEAKSPGSMQNGNRPHSQRLGAGYQDREMGNHIQHAALEVRALAIIKAREWGLMEAKVAPELRPPTATTVFCAVTALKRIEIRTMTEELARTRVSKGEVRSLVLRPMPPLPVHMYHLKPSCSNPNRPEPTSPGWGPL